MIYLKGVEKNRNNKVYMSTDDHLFEPINKESYHILKMLLFEESLKIKKILALHDKYPEVLPCAKQEMKPQDCFI